MSYVVDRPACADSPIPCFNCGYDLRGLSSSACCPECGHGIADSIEPPIAYPPAQIRHARILLAGLALLLLGSFASIGIVLIMPFSQEFGGTVPRLNYIGPKVWAVSLLQRAIGYGPTAWGNSGVTAGLTVALGLVLLTSSPAQRDWRDPILSLRFWARWTPLFLFGGFLGLTLGCEGISQDDPQLRKFVMAAVVGVELPGTVLLYWFLSALARELAAPAVGRAFAICAVAIPILQIGAMVMLVLARHLQWQRNDFPMQVAVSVFMAFSLCLAALAMGAIVRLAAALAPVAAPRFGKGHGD